MILLHKLKKIIKLPYEVEESDIKFVFWKFPHLLFIGTQL